MEAFTPILTDLGLPGLIIFALGWALWNRNKRADQLNDARIEDHKQHQSQLMEATRIIDRAARLMEGGRDV